jgi:hypothetical protein
MTFSKNGFEVVKNVLDQQSLKLLTTQFQMIKDVAFYTENVTNPFRYCDEQVSQCFAVYGAYIFDSLSLVLQDKISRVVGLNLTPTYSYARIYYKGSTLEKHTDRESCEYSTTICLSSTDDWPFCIKSKNGETHEIILHPGDMCIYSGCELEHWRNEFMGERVMQCFLHYVDKNGPNKEFEFDKRPMLGHIDRSPKLTQESTKKTPPNIQNILYK